MKAFVPMGGSMSSKTGRYIRMALAGAALGMMMGCTALYRNHGYVPSDEDLIEVIVGVDTQATVVDLIGPPTTGGALGDGNFYYVQSQFRHFAFMAPREIEREVLAVSFDSEGTVQNIERFGLEDGQVVRLSRRVTDDGIRDTTFLSQLFGAFGNLDAGTLINGPGG